MGIISHKYQIYNPLFFPIYYRHTMAHPGNRYRSYSSVEDRKSILWEIQSIRQWAIFQAESKYYCDNKIEVEPKKKKKVMCRLVWKGLQRQFREVAWESPEAHGRTRKTWVWKNPVSMNRWFINSRYKMEQRGLMGQRTEELGFLTSYEDWPARVRNRVSQG